MYKIEAYSRQSAGRIAGAAIEFAETVTITNVSGSEEMYIVEFESSVGRMKEEDIKRIKSAGA